MDESTHRHSLAATSRTPRRDGVLCVRVAASAAPVGRIRPAKLRKSPIAVGLGAVGSVTVDSVTGSRASLLRGGATRSGARATHRLRRNVPWPRDSPFSPNSVVPPLRTNTATSTGKARSTSTSTSSAATPRSPAHRTSDCTTWSPRTGLTLLSRGRSSSPGIASSTTPTTLARTRSSASPSRCRNWSMSSKARPSSTAANAAC